MTTPHDLDKYSKGHLQEQIDELRAQVTFLYGQLDRIERKAWPMHSFFNRTKRWKDGKKWWIDDIVTKMPAILKIDNTGGKGKRGKRNQTLKCEGDTQPACVKNCPDECLKDSREPY